MHWVLVTSLAWDCFKPTNSHVHACSMTYSTWWVLQKDSIVTFFWPTITHKTVFPNTMLLCKVKCTYHKNFEWNVCKCKHKWPCMEMTKWCIHSMVLRCLNHGHERGVCFLYLTANLNIACTTLRRLLLNNPHPITTILPTHSLLSVKVD